MRRWSTLGASAQCGRSSLGIHRGNQVFNRDPAGLNEHPISDPVNRDLTEIAPGSPRHWSISIRSPEHWGERCSVRPSPSSAGTCLVVAFDRRSATRERCRRCRYQSRRNRTATTAATRSHRRSQKERRYGEEQAGERVHAAGQRPWRRTNEVLSEPEAACSVRGCRTGRLNFVRGFVCFRERKSPLRHPDRLVGGRAIWRRSAVPGIFQSPVHSCGSVDATKPPDERDIGRLERSLRRVRVPAMRTADFSRICHLTGRNVQKYRLYRHFGSFYVCACAHARVCGVPEIWRYKRYISLFLFDYLLIYQEKTPKSTRSCVPYFENLAAIAGTPLPALS
jgi:hypothetical protein